ncbi:MAG TPA: glycosyltransferase [Fimbriimonas sp.]|nr:glycosyltransferase [Fimbriimonas sp.]
MPVRVSVLIPSYNHARFLPSALGSVEAQTFKDWEIVAVDDGSSDDSPAMLRNAAGPRIRFEENSENLGTYGSLDRALRLSEGEFIAVLNSDDLWAPMKLEKQVALLDSHPHLPYCYTLGNRVDEEGAVQQTDDHAHWPQAQIQELLPWLLTENRVLASSVVFRRGEVKFLPELRYSGDWAALLGPALRSKVGCIHEKLTCWRMHGNNTFTRSAGQVAEEIRLRESILADPTHWEIPRLSKHEVRQRLSTCAIHLSALYVLRGQMKEARRAAGLGLKFFPGESASKRMAAVSLPLTLARKALWGREPGVDALPAKPLMALDEL